MNWQVFTRAKLFTRMIFVFTVVLYTSASLAQWRLDLSRRMKSSNGSESAKTTANANDAAVERPSIRTPKVEVMDVSERDPGLDMGSRFDFDMPRALPPKEEFARETVASQRGLTSSRRTTETESSESTSTARAVKPMHESPVITSDVQDMVILHTDRGFVPASLRVRIGSQYRLHIVNVSNREKNVSFVLDAFAEHHATFFGQPKVVDLIPQRQGIFQFQCPETAVQGRLVVMPALATPTNLDGADSHRAPAARDDGQF